VVITQSADGFLWVGTNVGLVRFDGVRFAEWNPGAGQRLPDPRIFSILATRDGSLWIGSGYGVTRLRNGQLTPYPQAGGRIEAMVEDADGALWLARTQATDDAGPLCRIKNEQAQCYGAGGRIPFPIAIQLEASSSGELWIGGYDELCRWKGGSSDACFGPGRRHPETFASLKGVAVTRDGSVWAALDQSSAKFELQHFANGKWTRREFPEIKFNDADITTLFCDRDDVLWLGTAHHGIWRIRGDDVDHFGSIDGLSSDAVGRFYQDAEGTMWVITSEGIDNFRDLRVATFSTREGLYAAGASSVLAARNGTVWVGNFESMDAVRGNTVSGIRTGHGLPGMHVTTMFEDHSGRVWVGMNTGLWVYNDNRFQAVCRADGSALGIVFAITEDIQHNIWVRAGPKLARIEDLKIQSEVTSPQISTTYMMAPDPRGGLTLGLVNGDLVHYEPEKVQVLSAVGGPGSTRQIRDLLVEPDGSVWGTTMDSLFRWEDGVRRDLTTQNGLPCDGIFALVKDNQSAIWLYSRCGLIRIENSELNDWWAHPNKAVRSELFDAIDGVSPGLTGLKPQAVKSPDGRLWFVNGRFLQMVDPRTLHANHLPPPVQVEEIVADHKNYAAQDQLRLPPLTRDLEIEYAALSFVAPQKVQFRYKLDGRDDNWHDPGARRQAFYSDLGPGKYTFRVIAANSEGVWNTEGAVLHFAIAPAYYQTGWFRAVAVFLLLVLLWALYQLRLRQLQHQFEIGLEARVNERTRIARDLHDTLLQSFQGLMLRFQTVDEMLPARPVDAKKALEGALDRADQALIEGRDAIKDIRTSGSVGHDLTQSMTSLMTDLHEELAPCERDSVTFRVLVEGSPETVRPTVRDEIYRIARESLRNAFRHAQAQHIETEITYSEPVLRLRFRDDGKGIDPDVLEHGRRSGHWGLPGLRERAKHIGAQLDVWSKAGAGTEVDLRIPGSIAYETSPIRAGFRPFRKRTDQNHEHQS
jgi:signal transduction histidine kinase/ligand-binding sensor domain-containing protein